MKQVEIEHIPDTEVVYIRRAGQYGAENNALMERMKSWAAKRGLLTEDAVIYAIALDNPQSVAPEMCRYDNMLCGKAKEHPFLRTALLLTYSMLIVDGILAVCFMPHNPCAWVIFVLSLLLLTVPKYK